MFKHNGEDYFYSEDYLQIYVRDHYGWMVSNETLVKAIVTRKMTIEEDNLLPKNVIRWSGKYTEYW